MGRLNQALMMLLAGCVSAPQSVPAQAPAPFQQRLDALPSCQRGAEVGLLAVRPTVCTKKHCEEPCCNQCSWAATFQRKSVKPVPVEAARVRELLGLEDSALDCEIAAWNEALQTQPVSLEAPRCAVR